MTRQVSGPSVSTQLARISGVSLSLTYVQMRPPPVPRRAGKEEEGGGEEEGWKESRTETMKTL